MASTDPRNAPAAAGSPEAPSSENPSLRAVAWRLRTRTLRFGPLPALMGIVNVTPDSFSDGGRYLEPQAAIDHGLRLAAEGAAILDVGGESTRPSAQPVPAAEQLRRVLPVVSALAAQSGLPVSIDTANAEVAREAIAAGAEIVNDVTGLGDPAMVALVAETGPGVCAMHMQGTPRTMQDRPVYRDVVAEVLGFLRDRRDVLAAAGIAAERIALDPGIGFGKTTEHNLALLAAAGRLHELGCPILVGPSRKRFLRELADGTSQQPSGDPLYGTIGVAVALAAAGVQILRVHDVAPVGEALAIWTAAGKGYVATRANLR